MRAGLLLTAALIIVAALPARGQDVPAPEATTAACGALKDDDIPTGEANPIDFELGTEALVIKGSNILWTPAADPKGWSPWLDYTLDGQFSYDEEKDRIADLALQLASIRLVESDVNPFTDCGLKAGRSGFDLVPFAEVRGRFADIAKSGEQDWKGVLIGGAGGKVVLQIPALMALKGITGADVENPMLSLAYYNAFVDNDEQNPASSDTTIALDQIQLALTAEIPLSVASDRLAGRKFVKELQEFLCDPTLPCPQRPSYPYSISIEVKAGKPLQGEDRDIQVHADIGLRMMQPDKKVGFVLRYRTGEDLGFEYDNQLLAGVVYRFLQ